MIEIEAEMEKLRREASAYHMLADALDRLKDFCHLYGEYLYKLAQLKQDILEAKKER